MSSKSILVSILGSAVIIGLLGFFLLPFLFPAVNSNSIVLQSSYREWNSEAYIFDDDTLDYVKMNDTELSISIKQNSQLSITFSAIALLSLDPDFTIKNSYNISIVILGIYNYTFTVGYYDDTPASGLYIRQLTFNLFSNFLSQPLPAGTYTVVVFWKSNFDANGLNSLSVCHTPTWIRTRSLYIQEIKQV
ncbi:MAG: hypothetical protein ACFFA8_00215 [Promethearchaeota archaeon]